jgi:hypothetical protein
MAGVAWFLSRGAACLARLLLQTPPNRLSAAQRRPGAAVLPRCPPTFFSISHGSLLLQTGARSVRLTIWSSFPVPLLFLLAAMGCCGLRGGPDRGHAKVVKGRTEIEE